MISVSNLSRGVHNLLVECARAKPGQTLLILHEDHRLGYYGEGLAETVAQQARAMGLVVRLHEVPLLPDAEELPVDIAAILNGADHVLFLARLGDQLRFCTMPPNVHPIVSYALDTHTLASPFATASFLAFVGLKACFNEMFVGAQRIRVTCARGTDIEGQQAPSEEQRQADVQIKRFPLPIFAPLDAGGFKGRVAVAHCLVGTGSKYYEPYGIPIDKTVFAEIERARLVGWEGAPDDVDRVRAHYAFVANRYGIDRDVVHSWHAGIHPGCAYPDPAHANYQRWSGSAFGNPRLLHFHTCGAYAPGEICWNVVDPTIEVDGQIVWRQGRIDLDAVPGARECLRHYPDVAALFAAPATDIGIT